MPKLKTLLQFNKALIIFNLLVLLYVFLFTIIFKYSSCYPLDTTFIKGKITSFTINGDKINFDIKTQEKIKATYYIKSLKEKENLTQNLCIGCTITFKGKVNTLINNTIPNTFNYKKYLYNHKIYRTFLINDFTYQKDNNFIEKIKNYFYHHLDNIKNNDYLKIFILGDKSLISSEEYSLFQSNGIAHLLAISGMHIGVLLKIIDMLLKKIKLPLKVSLIFSIFLFYAFLVNFSSSILRAILFYLLLNLKKIFKLKISNFKLLIITADILIIFNPFIIYDVGFIYSFVITGGIILNHELIKGNYFKQLLILSLISFLFSLPITINLNYEINLTSIIANLIFVPLVSLIVYPLSLITFIFPIFSPIYGASIKILNFFNFLFGKISLFIIIPKLSFIFILVYYVLLVIALKRPKMFSMLILIILIAKYKNKIDSNYYVYYLDVGQGDSSVIISPYQKEVFMIDTGGKVAYEKETWQKSTKTYNLSDNSIKFLKSLGIGKINYLIISHGDFDHGGEALNIMNHLKVKHILINNGSINDLEKQLIKSGKVTNKIKSKYFYFKSLNNNLYEEENANSLVLYFKINKDGFLYMGDAPKAVEEKIINNYNLDVTFLKIGHHGSNTSSSEEFIKNLNFSYGIISSGRNNIYGHPHQETIATLEKYKRKYFNTQTSGTIKLKLKSNAYTITTYVP